MPDPIRLEPCPKCDTAFPTDMPKCPECGAPREVPAASARDPFAAFQAELFGGAGGGRDVGRSMAGLVAKNFLARNLGCFGTALGALFGITLLIGLLAGKVLGALAVLLLIVAGLGLASTCFLVWLVLPTRRKGKGGDDAKRGGFPF